METAPTENNDVPHKDAPQVENPIEKIRKELEGAYMSKESSQQKLKFRLPVPDRLKAPGVLTPKEIYRSLTKEAVGQEEAKKALAVTLFAHMVIDSDDETKSSNLLLIGPSGCGKTHLAQAACKISGLPFVRIAATSLVGRGYRGGTHSEQIIDFLISAAGGDIRKAQKSILFIDEIDKLAIEPGDDYGTGTLGVQKDLLDLIDGGTYYYEPDHDNYDRKKFSFKDVLFIFAGCFESGMKRVHGHDDLVPYGFLPEFANRITGIAVMDKLDENCLRQIAKKAVSGYRNILKLDASKKDMIAELILTQVMMDGSFSRMGARCIAPAVRAFFEERLFNM